MSVTVNQETQTITMTEEGDEVTIPMFIKGLRVDSASGVADDRVVVTDASSSTRAIWATTVTGSRYSEEVDWSKPRYSLNGIRLNTNTGNNATLYIYYA